MSCRRPIPVRARSSWYPCRISKTVASRSVSYNRSSAARGPDRWMTASDGTMVILNFLKNVPTEMIERRHAVDPDPALRLA